MSPDPRPPVSDQTPTPERRWTCEKPGWMGACSPSSTHHNGFDWGCGWSYPAAPPAPTPEPPLSIADSDDPSPWAAPLPDTGDGRPGTEAFVRAVAFARMEHFGYTAAQTEAAEAGTADPMVCNHMDEAVEQAAWFDDYLRTTPTPSPSQPVCPYVVTSDGGTSHCTLAEQPRSDLGWYCAHGNSRTVCLEVDHAGVGLPCGSPSQPEPCTSRHADEHSEPCTGFHPSPPWPAPPAVPGDRPDTLRSQLQERLAEASAAYDRHPGDEYANGLYAAYDVALHLLAEQDVQRAADAQPTHPAPDGERQDPNPWCLMCHGTGGKNGRCLCTDPGTAHFGNSSSPRPSPSGREDGNPTP